MSIAFLYPGQGEALAPTLDAWLRDSARVRARVAETARHLGTEIDEIRARGYRSLRRTALYQPVSVALQLGITAELAARGVRPDLVAGHSLGEVSAAAAAGFLEPAATLRTAVLRGAVMGDAARRHPGGMAALPSAEPRVVEDALRRGRDAGTVVVAAYNAPGQTVLSGDEAALNRVPEATRLPVEGAWHSPAMADAVAPYAEALRAALTRGPIHARMLFNATGAEADAPDAVPALLAGQLTAPVRWTAVMEGLRRAAPARWFILGPGRSLYGLVRDGLVTDVPSATPAHEIRLHRIETPADLDRCALEPASQ